MMNFLKTITDNRATMFFVALLLMSCIQIFAFFEIIGYEYNLRSTAIAVLCSSLTIYLPYLFISPRWRWSAWIPIAVFTIYMLTNVWYYRQFHSLYQGGAMLTGDIFNSFVIEGTIALMRPVDLWIALPPLTLIPLYVKLRHQINSQRYSLTFRIAMLLACILAPCAQTAFAFRRYCIYADRTVNGPNSLGDKWAYFRNVYIINPIRVTELPYNAGMAYMLIHTIHGILPDTVELTPHQTQQINVALSADDANPFEDNKQRNLILVIAESLNSEVLALPGEYGITPTLHKLLSDTSIVALNTMAQVGSGGSSDGQFVLNTGLYPLYTQPLVSHYASANYPSLAKALGYESSVEFIAEEKSVWNHYLTSESYGYSQIYDNLDGGGNDGAIVIDVDAKLFNKASEVLSETPQPFFAQITSISMHSPYDAPSVTPSLDENCDFVKSLSNSYRNYLEAAHHFDASLGHFIDCLRENGLLENSVIAIVADHNVPSQYLEDELTEPYIPMIIYNAGIKLNYADTIGQIDVFPTLLDVMGVESYVLPQTNAEYRGLGRSIIGKNPPTNAITAAGELINQNSNDSTLLELVELSSLMIQSRFFSTSAR